ncbi:hypothetical protein JHK84_036285 [Glycine max]|nr:hypothetical protein JHK85_036604 [Glycine max]KAG5129888.1 hypothetical protein JHK84_036285 [Glycine max]
MELQLANGSHEIDIHRNTDTILSEGVQNVNLISMGANNHITGGTTINQLAFRLRIIEVRTPKQQFMKHLIAISLNESVAIKRQFSQLS